jgi:hypothetical protein
MHQKIIKAHIYLMVLKIKFPVNRHRTPTASKILLRPYQKDGNWQSKERVVSPLSGWKHVGTEFNPL